MKQNLLTINEISLKKGGLLINLDQLNQILNIGINFIKKHKEEIVELKIEYDEEKNKILLNGSVYKSDPLPEFNQKGAW